MRGRGLFVAEGRLAVERLLASRFRARSLLVIDTALDGLAPALAAGGDERRPDVYVADSAQLRLVTGFRFHRGCLALGERPRAVAAGCRSLPRAGAADARSSCSRAYPTRTTSAPSSATRPRSARPGWCCRRPVRTRSTARRSGRRWGRPCSFRFGWRASGRACWRGSGTTGARVIALTPLEPATEIEAFVRIACAAPPSGLALLFGNEGDGVSRTALASLRRAGAGSPSSRPSIR